MAFRLESLWCKANADTASQAGPTRLCFRKITLREYKKQEKKGSRCEEKRDGRRNRHGTGEATDPARSPFWEAVRAKMEGK